MNLNFEWKFSKFDEFIQSYCRIQHSVDAESLNHLFAELRRNSLLQALHSVIRGNQHLQHVSKEVNEWNFGRYLA